jgi:putative membrane protein
MSVPEAGDRTVLAWRRSGLALVACGVAMVRGIGDVDTTRRTVAGGLVIVLGIATWGLFVWIARRRSSADLLSPPRPARLADMAPIAVSTAFIGVVCIAVDLWG